MLNKLNKMALAGTTFVGMQGHTMQAGV